MPSGKQTALKKFLLTSEHGGNNIPVAFKNHFIGFEKILDGHRGYDPGSLDLYRFLIPIADFHRSSQTSRLLVELNRSLNHPNLFSEVSKKFPVSLKKEVIKKYYQPYRDEVEHWIGSQINEGYQVIHFSIHTFTPVLNGKIRNTDIGLLYDPSRRIEKELCSRISNEIKSRNDFFKVRMNYPYKGISDGFTKYLRMKYPKNYAGIELEINQAYVENNRFPEEIKSLLQEAINSVINI